MSEAYQALIRGERRGPLAAAARGLLALLAWAFRLVVALRSALYRAGVLRARRVAAPVISVGNLSVGGTGKTPLVMLVARRLLARGARPAVLARGYGAARDGEPNDELRLIGEQVPDALLAPGRDRVLRAGEALARGATALVLDDGFQHRRLARDLDLVVLDATEPFGFPPGRLLPRGLLREPPAALRRAHALVLSRVELAGSEALTRIEAQARRHGFQGPILRMAFQPERLEVLARAGDGAEVAFEGATPAALAGRPVLGACGIGNPAAFAATLARLGARTTQVVALPDHHAYGAEDVARLEDLAARRAVRCVVVTEKDAVKLRALLGQGARRATWVALGVEARVEPAEAFEQLLDRALARGDGASPARAAADPRDDASLGSDGPPP